METRYGPHEIGEDGNDNRYADSPYHEVKRASVEQVGSPDQYQAE